MPYSALTNQLILSAFAFIAFSCQPPAHSSTEGKDSLISPEIQVPEPDDAATKTPADSLLEPAFRLPYDLKNPDATCKLPGRLVEISGLGYMKNGKLAIIEDEKGKIYILDTEKCEVESEWKFGNDGDYEAIEVVGDTAWVIRSDGMLYKVTDFASEERTTTRFKTPLSDQNDVEGMGYLAAEHQLLIACKAAPYLGKKQYKGKRAVYAYSLAENKLLTTPYLLIDLNLIAAARNDDTYLRISRGIASTFSDGGDINFQPSALAIHPLTGHLYVIATAGKLLLVFNQEKRLIGLQPLNTRLFKQPEGLCFSPKGDLYISNEGVSGAGNVLLFKQQPNEP
jgi:uncharacterized protein YjiK